MLIPAAAQMVQGGVAAVGYTGIRMGEKKADRHTPGTLDDQEERCDALIGSAPGVEEVRKTQDDAIETRQWRLINPADPKWMIVRTKSGPEDAWESKPAISRLEFTPPLSEQLDYEKSQFLAYAPNNTDDIDANRAMTNVNDAFGSPTGTFHWHGQTYGYVMVPQLPCFPVQK